MELQARRAIDIAQKTIDKLGLRLDGYTILTEVGSNNYLFTPLIPLIAGADEVIAFTRTTSYGKAEDNKAACFEIANELLLADRLRIETGLLDNKLLQTVDIVTNSGMLRPLDSEKLRFLKPGAVIPLMFEEWELRADDLDIEYCKANGIQVAGTWENHPDLQIFSNVGILALKMAFEAGCEVFGNNIIIWSDDEFGEEVYKSFTLNSGKCVLTTSFEVLVNNISETDFIFVCDYDELRPFSNIWDLQQMASYNQNLQIIHLFGSLKKLDFDNNGIGLYPAKDGLPSTMSFTLGHVGLKPIIDLQVAGFKVAQELLQGNLSSLSQKIC